VSNDWGEAEGTVFSHNAFCGRHENAPEDAHAITSDPMLKRPGSGRDGFGSVDGYKLQAGSPCIGAGMALRRNGERDFWGGILPKGSPIDIGAHQTSARRAGSGR
jgi:hypothetical protein